MKILVTTILFFITNNIWALTDLEKQIKELQRLQLEAVEEKGFTAPDGEVPPPPTPVKENSPSKKIVIKSKNEKKNTEEAPVKEADSVTENKKDPTDEEVCIAQYEGRVLEKYLQYYPSGNDSFINKLKQRHIFLKKKFTSDLSEYLIDNLSNIEILNARRVNGEDKNKLGESLIVKSNILLEKYNKKLKINNTLGGFFSDSRVSEINLTNKAGNIEICDKLEFEKSDLSIRNDKNATSHLNICIEYNFIDKKIIKGENFKDAYSNLLGSENDSFSRNLKGHPVIGNHNIDEGKEEFIQKELTKLCKKKSSKDETHPPKIHEGKRNSKAVPHTKSEEDSDQDNDVGSAKKK